MAINEQDQQVLAGLAAARNQHGELADLLDFYHDLYELQFTAKGEVSEPEVRDDLAMCWRLEGGIPQLTFDQLRLEAEPFERLVARIADVLVRYNPGWQLERDTWVPEELVKRAREVFETWDTLTAGAPGASGQPGEESSPDDLTALAVGFSLAPYLQKAADVILPKLDLTSWGRGHCPVCGGRPNFSVLAEESGARSLMCSRCAVLWPYLRIGCPFCTTEERPIYYTSEDELHRLYECRACSGYLKAVDLRRARRIVYPMVERLLTVGMDLAAQEEGYGG